MKNIFQKIFLPVFVFTSVFANVFFFQPKQVLAAACELTIVWNFDSAATGSSSLLKFNLQAYVANRKGGPDQEGGSSMYNFRWYRVGNNIRSELMDGRFKVEFLHTIPENDAHDIQVVGDLKSGISADSKYPRQIYSRVTKIEGKRTSQGAQQTCDASLGIVANPAANSGGGNTGGSGGQNQNTSTRCVFDTTSVRICNPLGADNLKDLVLQLLEFFLGFIAVLSVTVIVIGGLRMVVANGNPDQIKSAKASVQWAVIGLVVALLAYSIVAIVENILKNAQ